VRVRLESTDDHWVAAGVERDLRHFRRRAQIGALER